MNETAFGKHNLPADDVYVEHEWTDEEKKYLPCLTLTCVCPYYGGKSFSSISVLPGKSPWVCARGGYRTGQQITRLAGEVRDWLVSSLQMLLVHGQRHFSSNILSSSILVPRQSYPRHPKIINSEQKSITSIDIDLSITIHCMLCSSSSRMAVIIFAPLSRKSILSIVLQISSTSTATFRTAINFARTQSWNIRTVTLGVRWLTFGWNFTPKLANIHRYMTTYRYYLLTVKSDQIIQIFPTLDKSR